MQRDEKSEATEASLATDGNQYGSMERAVSYTENNEEIERASHDPESGEPEPRPAITFADLGIPTGAQLQDTVVGKARAFKDIPWKERIYTILMLLSIAGVLAMTIYRVCTVSSDDPDFTFGLVLILNATFCAVLVVDGVLRERPSELFILSLATGIITVYLIVNYALGTQNTLKLVRLIVAVVFAPGLIFLGLQIAREYHLSKHLIFRTVGANETLQIQYRKLLFLEDVLKLDVQLGASMIILIVVSKLSVDTKDIVILSVGGAFTVAWFFLGLFTFRREIKLAFWIFFSFCFAEPGYVGYKMYDVSTYIDTYPGVAGATIACGALALLVRLVLMIGAYIVYRDFGIGLKEKLEENKSKPARKP